MRKFLIVAVLFVAPSLASAQGLGEILEGLTNPQLVAGVLYDDASAQKWNAILTANILGPKLGSIPCYVSGVGASLNTVAPGLEDAPIAAWSFPLLTCAPFGEQVVIQGGMATPMNGNGEKSYYVGIGVSVDSPNTLKAKRIKRIEAKAKAKNAKRSEMGPEAPAS